MNDSNNNFGVNLTSNTSQSNNTSNVNSIPITQQNEISHVNTKNFNSQVANSYNTQMNGTIVNDNISQPVVNSILVDNISSQQAEQSNQNLYNNISFQQNYMSNQVNDDDLLKAFIGNNYEKITTKSFNFAGFFLTSFYMFYRKMFLYALLVFIVNLVILNVIDQFIVTLVFNAIVGFTVNKIYLSYAKKKIDLIKVSNSQKSTEELKSLCTEKGGTSGIQVVIGLITEIVIAIIILFVMAMIGVGGALGNLFDLSNWNFIANNGGGTPGTGPSSTNGTILENVSINGYGCFGSKCNVTIISSNGNSEDYTLSINNSDFFNKLGDYKDYIKLNIYYNNKGNVKTIVGYKIFLKSNNEDISNISTENELRNKIGLYSLGMHTETLTLRKIGITGYGFADNESYIYTVYTFVDGKNIEYEMKYKNNNGSSNLVEGRKYSVTFEVSKGTFEYEYNIKSIN